MLRRFVCLAVCVACGCSETPSLPDLNVSVIDAVGGSPLTGRDITSVRVLHREGDGELVESVADVADGTFDLALALTDFSAINELRIALRSAGGVELTGSTPLFYPGEGSTVRIVVGAPGTCDVVTASQLPIERKAIGAVTLGTFALLIGGIEPSGSSERIGWHDLLLHTPGSVDYDLPLTPGRSRAAAISRTRALIVSEGDDPFIYDLYATSAPRTTITTHPGARNASAVLAVGDAGAIAIGGVSNAMPVTGVSFVTSEGGVIGASLALAVVDRVAAYAAESVYVVSRLNDAAMLERIVLGDSSESTVVSTLIASFVDDTRNGATLFFSADGSEGLLIGGEDENGDVRTDTVRFTGCPGACVASAGPEWTTARARPMTDPAGYLVGGEGPSALVDRVTFGAGGPVITALGPLENPRFDGGLLTHPSGALIVFGGEGSSGIRRDVEMCFPPSID